MVAVESCACNDTCWNENRERVDEFGLRGYQLFSTGDLATAEWEHLPGADLPDGARHGSVLAITADERARLLETP